MFNTNTIKTLAVLGLATAAVASQALTFTTEESGAYTVSGSTYTSPFFVFATQGAASFNSGTLVYTESGSSFTGTFSLTAKDASGSVLGTLSYALTGTYTTLGGAADSLAGTAVTTGGTGIYSGYTGTGTFSDQTVFGSASTYGAFTSTVTPAPEPISTAIIVGALGTAIVKRRKKA